MDQSCGKNSRSSLNGCYISEKKSIAMMFKVCEMYNSAPAKMKRAVCQVGWELCAWWARDSVQVYVTNNLQAQMLLD